jgi:tRNA-uridine 2-sulfurtransferase
MSTETAAARVVVGLSGGVDSAVAAVLLQQQGYEVEGLFMSNWQAEDDDAYCTSAQDFQDARAVCAALGIPLHRADFSAEYLERVFSHFLSELEAGRTPNPDVLCNAEIKFDAFLDYATRLGADFVATGHYARLEHGEAGPLLMQPTDADKDQTYFLHAVPQAAFERVLFPLTAVRKDTVRDIARDTGLPVFDKKDSTGICFIGERPFRDFLSNYVAAQPGDIRDLDNRKVGEHGGLFHYTIGQRKGLGIGGIAGGDEKPWYVVAKELDSNTLRAVQGDDHPALFRQRVSADQLHWIGPAPESCSTDITARIRYRQVAQACEILEIDADRLQVRFSEPQRAVTPGQYLVLYQGQRCLGGGVICTERKAQEAA